MLLAIDIGNTQTVIGMFVQRRRDSVAEANGDVRIRVKRSARLRDLDSRNRAQPFNHVVAPLCDIPPA